MQKFLLAIVPFCPVLFLPAFANSAQIYVATDGTATGDGSLSSPLDKIQTAISRAVAGDEVIVQNGIYSERLNSVRGGTGESSRIVIRAANAGQAQVTNAGRVLSLDHPFMTFDGLVFDGQFGGDDIVRVKVNGDSLHLRNMEIRNTRRDALDIGSFSRSANPGSNYLENVLIEQSKIHHALWINNGTITDAHGIVAGGVRDLTV